MEAFPPEYLRKIEEKIRLEYKRYDIEHETLNEIRKARVAGERRARVLEAIFERYADLGERVTGLMNLIQECLPANEIFREWLADLSEQVEQINRVMILLLAQKGNGAEGELRKVGRKLVEQHRKSLRKQLATYLVNLNSMEEKKAQYGSEVPIHLFNQIERTKEEIERIKRTLEDE